jgi:hypothetical protein
MTYAQSLFAELVESERFAAWQQQLTETGPVGSDQLDAAPDRFNPADLRTLSLVRSELLHVGAITAVVTSIANALEAGIFPNVRPSALQAFSPALSASLIASLNGMCGEATFARLAESWQEFGAHLSFAQQLARNYLDDAAQSNQTGLFPIEVVADSWRRVCHASVALHACIAEVMASSGQVCDPAVESRTLVIMSSAARGGWPCLDNAGCLSVPGWAERRSERRREVNAAVTVTSGGVTMDGYLRNATSIGLGLDVTSGLYVGTQLAVQVPDGRSLAGYVQWFANGKAGIRLAAPLPADDPLLHHSLIGDVG